MTPIKYLLLFSLVLNNLTNYGRRHFKLFTNCHVSWGHPVYSWSANIVNHLLASLHGGSHEIMLTVPLSCDYFEINSG